MWWKILLGLLATFAVGFMVLLSRVDITPGIILHSILGTGGGTPSEETMASRLKAPDGFSVGLYAKGVENARFIEFTENGDLLVSQPRNATISLIERDRDDNGISDGQRILMKDLNRPHGIDFYNGYLYVAESDAIGRIKFDHQKGEVLGAYERIISGLGDTGNHWTKSIRFGPDGLLYLSSGSTCNVCKEEDQQRATITRYQPDGSDEERVATGLRNSVGFDWAPFDQQLYATDNGRDLLGDDYPPCELNRIETGKFYGWPNVNGFGDTDPDFPDKAMEAIAVPPVHGFRPHNAPLGIRFITGNEMPDRYHGAALVALHGSWNRNTYDGYKVVSLHWNGKVFEERDFLSGFEKDGDVIGRPVDIAEGPDGCAYVSDDFGLAIYRVCYGVEQQMTAIAADIAITETGLEYLDEASLLSLQEQGQQLFQTRGCVACHVAGRNKTAFGLKPLNNISERFDVDRLATFYKAPTPPMPPVRLQGKEETLALSAYLLSL